MEAVSNPQLCGFVKASDEAMEILQKNMKSKKITSDFMLRSRTLKTEVWQFIISDFLQMIGHMYHNIFDVCVQALGSGGYVEQQDHSELLDFHSLEELASLKVFVVSKLLETKQAQETHFVKHVMDAQQQAGKLLSATKAAFLTQFPKLADVYGMPQVSDADLVIWSKFDASMFILEGAGEQTAEKFMPWLLEQIQRMIAQRREQKGLVVMPYVDKIVTCASNGSNVGCELNVKQLKELFKDVDQPCNDFLMKFMLASGHVDDLAQQNSVSASVDMRDRVNAAMSDMKLVMESERAVNFFSLSGWGPCVESWLLGQTIGMQHFKVTSRNW